MKFLNQHPLSYAFSSRNSHSSFVVFTWPYTLCTMLSKPLRMLLLHRKWEWFQASIIECASIIVWSSIYMTIHIAVSTMHQHVYIGLIVFLASRVPCLSLSWLQLCVIALQPWLIIHVHRALHPYALLL